MNTTVFATMVVSIIALIAGLILAIASVVMAVPVNKKTEELRNALPGANCGACGFASCDNYAEAMGEKGAKVGLCTPGGVTVANLCADILGVDSELIIKTAMVKCHGCSDVTYKKLQYHGIPTCKAADLYYAGDGRCMFGCLGYGDCMDVCEVNCITVVDGIATINSRSCIGCGKCQKTCPKHLIELVPANAPSFISCNSNYKPARQNKICKNGCLGCKKCEKLCPHNAIHVENFLAVINPSNCVGCGICANACPVQCIVILPHN